MPGGLLAVEETPQCTIHLFYKETGQLIHLMVGQTAQPPLLLLFGAFKHPSLYDKAALVVSNLDMIKSTF